MTFDEWFFEVFCEIYFLEPILSHEYYLFEYQSGYTPKQTAELVRSLDTLITETVNEWLF